MKPCRRATGWLCAALVVLATVGLSCSSLPTIVPDLGHRSAVPAKPVPMDGAQGPLSAAQSRAVLQRLQQGGQPTDIFSRHLALEEALVGSPLTTGNAVRLLEDGPATYRAMLPAIAQAVDHINMETYILDDDAIGQQFSQALLAKQAQGVQVNLLRDSAGTFTTPWAFFQRLSDAGVQVLALNPVNPLTAREGWPWNQRDHRKLLIVDGHTAFLGGINISSVYSGGSFGKTRPAGAQPALDWRSFLHNHELNAVMLGADFGRQVQALFERDLAASDRIELPTWQGRGPGQRVQEWFARLWEYWV